MQVHDLISQGPVEGEISLPRLLACLLRPAPSDVPPLMGDTVRLLLHRAVPAQGKKRLRNARYQQLCQALDLQCLHQGPCK